MLVKAAEADSETKHLLGMGIARQRKAIVDGLRSTVNEFSTAVEGSSAQDVLDLLLLTQYFDALKEMNPPANGPGSTIFVPHGPQAVQRLRESLDSTFSSVKSSTTQSRKG